MRYISIILFLFILISGCAKDVQLPTPVKSVVDTTSVTSFPRITDTYGWNKVNLNSSVSDFAFDSQGNIYFINSQGLCLANKNFVIKNTLVETSSSLRPDKIFINENDILFLAKLGFNHQLFVSNDKGKTWITPTGFKNTQITNFFSKGNRVYITSCGGDESAAMIQMSEDSGNNWRTIINAGTTSSFYFCKENSSNEIFFTGKGSLYYSNDYGATYTFNKFNFPYPWDNSLAFGLNKNLIVGNSSGIFLTSDNGQTWKSIHENTDPSYFFTLFNSSNGLIYSMNRWLISSSDYGLKSVYVSKDGGISFYSFLSAPDGVFTGTFHLGVDGYLYIVCNDNNVNTLYRSAVKL